MNRETVIRKIRAHNRACVAVKAWNFAQQAGMVGPQDNGPEWSEVNAAWVAVRTEAMRNPYLRKEVAGCHHWPLSARVCVA